MRPSIHSLGFDLRSTLLTALIVLLSLIGAGCECGITESPVTDDDDITIPDDDDDTFNEGVEDCSNGLDDDGDGAIDCADTDCEADAACSHNCIPAEEIACGDVINANNASPGSSDAVDVYGCTTWDESGPERTYSFTPETTEEVTLVLQTSGQGNLDLFVLDAAFDCDGTACIAYGASSLHFTAQQGDEYYIVVDGYAGGQDNFSLEVLCPSGGGDGENCLDGIDNDGDGAVDCDDTDCASDPACIEEACDNNFDDDGDGYTDCDDTECWNEPICDPEDCTDGVDNNTDGLVDCDDPDCFGQAECTGEDCKDLIDNDGDGDVDCDDADCAGDTDCIPEGSCIDGVDGDGDGFTDCDDDECDFDPECVGEDCVNGFDDDGDGFVDCDDTECASNPSCVSEDCTNNVDDDGDGDVDCDDTECASAASCQPICAPSGTLTCGGTLTGDTQFGPDVIQNYGCTSITMSGNEVAYSFTASASGEISVSLSALSADLDLFAVADSGGTCDAGNCLDSSTSGGTTAETVTLTATAGTTYYFVIDGFNNTVGTYEIALACGTGPTSEDCTNGVDDDGDGDIDCDDSDCAGTVGCAAEDCANGTDDDGDGAVDCADTDCASDPGCLAEDCFNGIDDDADGDVDCDDSECSIQPACGSENCINGIDDDGDLDIDCDDSDCTGDPVCNPSPSTENCSNGVDDDGDGAVDCADTADCSGDPACGGPATEICDNGTDDDGDGLVDCADPSCSSDPACGGTPTEICDDSVDNDGDGDVDCADSNCTLDPSCGGSGGENCANGVDDNGDGDVDCDDSLCEFDPVCLEEICGNGSDDDLDGQVDCADSDCSGDSSCIPEACNNGVDDDGDGDIDCADSECATAPACVAENCSNGIDDDGDGQVDCADIECNVFPGCVAELCSNGVDDDGDGQTDCDDDECTSNPVCASAAEICDNDIDDNGNGQIDCAEASCASASVCIAEICWNGTDDDGDGDADCDDSECLDDINCGPETCWNGTDDDGDGDVDCDDEDCIGWSSCSTEVCDDGVDNDGDTLIDCDDEDCVWFGDCIGEECDNDIDDDGDGDVDCGDSDCDSDPACTASTEVCDDNLDNDSDGAIDCADSDCTALPACAEDCSDNVDNDGDGSVDCDDADCTGEVGCVPEVCDNGIDDDGDGDIDCGDADCLSTPECVPEGDCDDGVDGDGDGDVDCDDDECQGEDPVCGEVCDNGIDDDADGDVDCDDVDCETDDDCLGTTPGVGGTCLDVFALNCGDTDSWFNYSIAGTDNIDQYSCSTWDESGPEYTYAFRPEVTEEVIACIENFSEDLDLFAISDAGGGCDGGNCIDYGNNCVVIDAVAGETYYIVVDGYAGSESSYDIELSCPSTDEICDNGVDDDMNGLIDCDDEASCGDSLDCIDVCVENFVLSCGVTHSYSTEATFTSDAIDSYNCSTWDESGPEVGYYFQAPVNQANEVTVALNYNFGQVDLDVFVLSDEGIPCANNSCVEFGTISANFETLPGNDYWIVVDGYQGDSGAYDITVSCNAVGGENCSNGIDDDADGDVDCDDTECEGSPLCASACTSIQTVACGVPVSGDTSDSSSGATNEIGGYPCSVGNFSGPEIAYEWTANVSGTVEWGLINPQPSVLNQDVFVLDGDNGLCLNTQCLAQGFNNTEFEAIAGHTYYLVVDGFNGASGAYTAMLDCNP